LEYDLRNRFFAHVHSLDLQVLRNESVGQLVSRDGRRQTDRDVLLAAGT
jgi:ABC-type bacteriocin/lantibiotic exporter with double-glycine peptidase domain